MARFRKTPKGKSLSGKRPGRETSGAGHSRARQSTVQGMWKM